VDDVVALHSILRMLLKPRSPGRYETISQICSSSLSIFSMLEPHGDQVPPLRELRILFEASARLRSADLIGLFITCNIRESDRYRCFASPAVCSSGTTHRHAHQHAGTAQHLGCYSGACSSFCMSQTRLFITRDFRRCRCHLDRPRFLKYLQGLNC
jgi:hypothetical protein